MTEAVHRSIHAGLFRDPKWLQNEDRVFARMYFNTYDNYEAGRLDQVPVAWRLAFDSAKKREMGALGDFLMAMNAHINRDMPYMLAGTGIRNPDGTSRKPDHDVWNKPLAALYQPVLREVAERFDPTADDIDAGPIDNEMAFAILESWREGVWRNAERLTNARTEQERRQVAASIEAFAATTGRTIRTMERYPPGQDTRARDAWCAEHGGQQP